MLPRHHTFQPQHHTASSAPTTLISRPAGPTPERRYERKKTWEAPDSDLKRIAANDPALVKVNWNHKDIGDDRVIKLVKELHRNTHVTSLEFYGNDNITDISAKDLKAMLLRNSTITHLNLAATKISEDLKKEVHRLVKINEETFSPEEARQRKEEEFRPPPAPPHSRSLPRRASLPLPAPLLPPPDGGARRAGRRSSMHGLWNKLFSLQINPLQMQESHKRKLKAGREIMQMAIETPNFTPVPIPLQYITESTESFSEERRLGEGSSSWVFVGKDSVIRRKFAVKRMKFWFHANIDLSEARRMFEREIMTLKHFCHPNIARLYAYHLDPDLRGSHCLVYELASLGSLYEILRNGSQRGRLDWTKRINIALDVARALQYMHSGKGGQICFHRDVKSSNICLRRNHTALLIDCGIAKMIPLDDSKATMTVMESGSNGLRGTPGYICPTFGRRQKNYGSANEVFSLGIVFTELFTGLLQNERIDGEEIDLFDRYSEDGIRKLDLVSDVDVRAGQWNVDAKEAFANLTLQCIAQHPEGRPRVNEIVVRLEKLASQARPWSVGERNRITVLSSAPLVYFNEGEFHPISMFPNFALERDLLSRCIEESNRDIELIFDVATDDRLKAASIKRCGCLHFSGHGHHESLLFEDNEGGALWLGGEKLVDCVHKEPFIFAFISACHSLFMGEALVKAGVKHVVCCELDAELRDDVALKFTSTFYLALAKGYTLLDSFLLGKDAVSTRYDRNEVKKFVLLPTNGTDHKVPIFPGADELQWKDEVKVAGSIPTSPQSLKGREKEEWYLLNLILSSQFVNLVGHVESERCSMATAVCHFINDRRTVMLSIEVIYYLQATVSRKGFGEKYVRHLHNCLALEGRVRALESGSNIRNISESILHALQRTKALIVIEILKMDSLLMNFLASILSETFTKVLVVSREELDFSQAGIEAPEVFDACDGNKKQFKNRPILG